jgi:excisionase family DNA binding protein
VQDVQDMQQAQEVQQRHHGSRLLSADDVMRMVGVDRSTVYRMAADGRLPAVKVGKQWRFPASSIEALLRFGTDETQRAEPELPPSSALSVAAQPVVDVAGQLLGVMMLVTDLRGRPLTRVANPCPWFVTHGADDDVFRSCAAEWRELAGGDDLTPRFRLGEVGFECAGAFIRSGPRLVGLVLAGGVAPADRPAAIETSDGLHHLTERERRRVLDALPMVAAALSRSATATPEPMTD